MEKVDTCWIKVDSWWEVGKWWQPGYYCDDITNLYGVSGWHAHKNSML